MSNLHWVWSADAPPPADEPVIESWGNRRYAVVQPGCDRDWIGRPAWYMRIPPGPIGQPEGVFESLWPSDQERSSEAVKGFDLAEEMLKLCAAESRNIDLRGPRRQLSDDGYRAFLQYVEAFCSAVLRGNSPEAAMQMGPYGIILYSSSDDEQQPGE